MLFQLREAFDMARIPAANESSETQQGIAMNPNSGNDSHQAGQCSPGKEKRWNEIHSVSEGARYVTLLLAEIDARERKLRYVNSGHNPALLFRAQTDTITHLNSSCPPIGMFPEEICKLTSTDLIPGDVLVFYTDGVTEAEKRSGEEFGMERHSAVVRRGSSLTADELKADIFRSAADFCGEVGFGDDVTMLVVKCDFEGSAVDGADFSGREGADGTGVSDIARKRAARAGYSTPTPVSRLRSLRLVPGRRTPAALEITYLFSRAWWGEAPLWDSGGARAARMVLRSVRNLR